MRVALRTTILHD